MADRLPIMAPASVSLFNLQGLGCWARSDESPLDPDHDAPHSPYWGACGDEPASDLGLCAHHLATIFPPEVRHAPPHA
jgi:hypothetical protein